VPIEQRIAKFAASRWASGWYALYTRHQCEKVVCQALSDKGFDAFLPQYRAIHSWKDRRKELLLPLFPNYVFIRGGLDRMLNILTTPGVHSLVAWGGRPANIPQEEIDAIRRLVDSSLRIEPHPFLKCGDRVRIKSGPLEGIQGILVRKRSAFRLVLSVEMLAQSASAEVDISVVERVRCAEVDRNDVLRNDKGVPSLEPGPPYSP